jgi:predicted transcriptional regulator
MGGSDFAMYSLEIEPAISNNRTRLEILASVLNVAQHGALKTHIMYKANLSHKQLEKYLGFLKAKGLLEEVPESDESAHMYRITDKGIQFLKDYTHVSNYLD